MVTTEAEKFSIAAMQIGAGLAVGVGALSAAVLLLFGVASMVAPTRPVSYCTIKYDSYNKDANGPYQLVGYRPNQGDQIMGVFQNYDAAVDGAKKFGCPFNVAEKETK